MDKNTVGGVRCNVPNRTIFLHDNLEILQGINDSCIDLIYLDPPFNKNKIFAAPIGSTAEGAEFRDIFRKEDVKEEWLKTIGSDHDSLFKYLNGIQGVGKPYNFAYLAYMAIRLIECHRILKETGSLYLHCDPTMSHYLKTTLDCIFGEQNFRNEIVWHRIKGAGKITQHEKRTFGPATESILFYAKGDGRTLNLNDVLIPYSEQYVKSHFKYRDEKGVYGRRSPFNSPGQGARPNQCYEYKGFYPPHPSGWNVTLPTLKKMDAENDLEFVGNRVYRKQRPRGGIMPNSLWLDINVASGNERVGYPTQKPLALLDRIIKTSSNEGDIVLDPFCGCATTCVSAENNGRQWIGIDVSVKAYDLVKERLDREVAHPDALPTFRNEIHLKTRPPKQSGDVVKKTRHVYIISHSMFKEYYKVGVAKNVQSRLNSYQTGDPERSYKLEFSHETHLPWETEAHVHKHFDNKYEWVRADLEEIKHVIVNYAGA